MFTNIQMWILVSGHGCHFAHPIWLPLLIYEAYSLMCAVPSVRQSVN